MGSEQQGTQLNHGGYAVDTCFKITRHDYAGGQAGYFEILEIHDAPSGYPQFMVVVYIRDTGYEFCYGKNLKSVKKAASVIYGIERPEKWTAIPGITKVVVAPSRYCEPWCYASTAELVSGDYTLPADIIRSDKNYPQGKIFFVLGNNAPTIEQCHGVYHGTNGSYVYLDQGNIFKFAPGQICKNIVDVADPVWHQGGMKSMAEFWNDFLAKGIGEEDEDSLEALVQGTKATLRIFNGGDHFNFHFSVKELAVEESFAVYSRFDVIPKQLTKTLIQGDMTAAHMLCTLFKKD